MLRAVADSVANNLLKSFPADRARRPSDLEADPMPPAVAHFLKNRLKQRIHAEVANMRSQWIDHDDPRVLDAFDNVARVATEAGFIPPDGWQKALEEAVYMVIMHLVRPGHALALFIFRDKSEALPVNAVQQRLAFFSNYPYIREILEGYFGKKEVTEVNKDQLDGIVTRIDRRMVENYEPEDWVSLLQPLFSVMALVDGKEAVPTSLLRMFFDDKHRQNISRRLLHEEQIDEREGLVKSDLLKLLQQELRPRVQEVPVEAPSVVEREERVVREPAIVRAATIAPTPAPPAPDAAAPMQVAEKSKETNSAIPLWQRYADPRYRNAPVQEPRRSAVKDLGDRTQPTTDLADTGMTRQTRAETMRAPEKKQPEVRKPAIPSPPENPGTAKKHSTESSGAVPLWMRYAEPEKSGASRGTKPPAPASELDDLERKVLGNLPLERRKWFIQNLFEGSSDEYQRTLAQLHRSQNWASASKIIAKEVFQKNQVNIYSEPAVAFTDAVESRFSEPSRQI